MDRILLELSAKDIYENSVMIGPNPDSIVLDSLYGVGLKEGETYGYIIVGINQTGKPIDCSPNVTEYGNISYDQDIYFGFSNITWTARSSDTGDNPLTRRVEEANWSPWYTSLKDVPKRQFVQFKFEFFRNFA